MTKTQLKEKAKDDMCILLEEEFRFMSSLISDDADDEEFRYYLEQCRKLACAMLSRIGRSFKEKDN